MAHKKGGSSTKNGRESHSKRLGVKLFGGQYAIPGNIIIRQRGTRVHPGINVGMGKDHTLFAVAEGYIVFERMRGRSGQQRVSVYPQNPNLQGGMANGQQAPAAAAESAAD